MSAHTPGPVTLPYKGHPGPHHGDGQCLRCGKQTRGQAVSLELDRRVNEYHDFGGIPDDHNQGGFDFGPDCAKVLRERAKAALAAQGIAS